MRQSESVVIVDKCNKRYFTVGYWNKCNMELNLLFGGGTRPTQNSPRNQVIISEIRTEDLEKSPAPVLPCVHNHLQPAFVETSSIDLPPDYLTIAQSCTEGESLAKELPPDYLTAVRNHDINELNLSAFVQTSSIDLPPDYCTVAQSSNTCNDIDVESSSEELPVYFTAVQNISELDSSMDCAEIRQFKDAYQPATAGYEGSGHHL